MSKQDQFLVLVQTAVLANGINLSLNEDAKAHRHEFSATGVLGLMQEALYASERIPDELSAADAAWEFCGYMIGGLREHGEECPAWFARS